jgi:hypothetical protein
MVKLFDTGGIHAVLEGFEAHRMTEETRRKIICQVELCQKLSTKRALLIGDFASVDNKYMQ